MNVATSKKGMIVQLKSVEFSELEGTPQHWRLREFRLGQVNLIVGKNASGKTRTLNIVSNIAKIIAGDVKLAFTSNDWTMKFAHDAVEIEYAIRIRDKKVESEQFKENGKILLNRSAKGEGTIYAIKEKRHVDFQTDQSELAVVARRDRIQHPYFDKLFFWAKSLHHYQFNTTLGQDSILIIREGPETTVDTRETHKVIAMFRSGDRTHGAEFRDAIKDDMATIGYPITEIGLAPPRTIIVKSNRGGEVFGLYVKETDLVSATEQDCMSSGMFRALSIVIQFNFAELTNLPSCILIDDIGEGLDFERSSALIQLLVAKAKKTDVQLIMTTNDRFVMNNVPLENWSVLKRESDGCRVFNYHNAKVQFDEFKFTGLNNFDFLAADFLSIANGSHE